MPRTKINKSQLFPGVELAELCHRAKAEVTSLAEEEEQLLVRQSRSHLKCPWHWNSLAIPHPSWPMDWNRATWKTNCRSCLKTCRWWSEGGEKESNQPQTETWCMNFRETECNYPNWALAGAPGNWGGFVCGLGVLWAYTATVLSSRDKIMSVLRELLRLCWHIQGWKLTV